MTVCIIFQQEIFYQVYYETQKLQKKILIFCYVKMKIFCRAKKKHQKQRQMSAADAKKEAMEGGRDEGRKKTSHIIDES